jgi:two-component system, response regulator PdtaR
MPPDELEDEEAGLARRSGATTILIVEDHPLIRMALADTLHGAGYQVLEAQEAGEGFGLLMREGGAGLVIADVGVPGEMDGVMLARVVREHWPETPLLMISGRQSSIGLDLPAGAAFLSKPVAPALLLEEVAALLGSD